MPTDSARELLRFGSFELDPDREELRRSGLVLRLPHQPFRVLVMLARRAGEVVSREEIRKELWGNETYVDFEQGINTAIRHIRFHLGDHAEAPRFIRTLPRRGYVFIAPVERLVPPKESPPAAKPRTRRSSRFSLPKRLSAAATAAVLITVITPAMWHLPRSDRPRQRTVAVLPPDVIGRLPDGLDPRAFAEELRTTIGALPSSRVTLLDPGSADRADVRIEGTIREVRTGARVIVRGIDARSRTQLWSQTFDRPAARTSGMTIEVAHGVAMEVARRFLPRARHEPLLRTRVSPRVSELYRRARIERSRLDPDHDFDRVRKLFEQLVREEADFAEAWSGLADLWVERVLIGFPMPRAYAAARASECARRALALQPANAEARTVLGLLAAQHEYDLNAAEAAFRRAIADDPEYPDAHHNLAVVLTARGNFDEALREWERARDLAPADYDLHPIEPVLYLHARRYEDALARLRDILAVQPESQAAHWGVLTIYAVQRRWSEATATARQIADQSPENGGERATAETFHATLRSLEPMATARFNDYALAIFYAQAGDRDRAFERLGRAVDQRVPLACYLLVDPRLDPLRSDIRFRTLVARTRLAGQQRASDQSIVAADPSDAT